MKDMNTMKLNKLDKELLLYAVAKMIGLDGNENKEMWKELFLKLNDADEKEIFIGCPITLGEYEKMVKEDKEK